MVFAVDVIRPSYAGIGFLRSWISLIINHRISNKNIRHVHIKAPGDGSQLFQELRLSRIRAIDLIEENLIARITMQDCWTVELQYVQQFLAVISRQRNSKTCQVLRSRFLAGRVDSGYRA